MTIYINIYRSHIPPKICTHNILRIPKTQKQENKRSNYLNKQKTLTGSSSKKDICMTSKHTTGCSTSFTKRELQIKAMVRYYYISIRMIEIKVLKN